MIEGIAHVGIMVKNLDEAVNLYCESLSLERPRQYIEWPTEGMRHAMLRVGDQAFELMEPQAGSFLARFIEKRGEGIHHVSLIVRDMQSLVRSLEQKGVTLIDRGPQVSFIHPRSMNGVLLELRQVEWEPNGRHFSADL